MSKRILVVDDQEDLRAILRDLLSASGHDVIEAADGGDGYVIKPYSPVALLGLIQCFLGKPG